MAEVTGPIATLPGALHNLPDGTMCDVHHDRPAVSRIQGETDSFGSELWDCCQECLDDMKKEPPQPCTCDWCKTPNVITSPMRDYEEGMYGRVYEVCKTCRDQYNKQAQADMDEDDRYYGREYLEPEPLDNDYD
jgi:hypothetical protein